MGSSNNGASQQQIQSRSQQQAQAALQASQHNQQSMQHNWYANMPPQQQLDQMALPQANFDINFDFTQFDLGTGSDADLSALFIPDAVMWNVAPTDPNIYGGY